MNNVDMTIEGNKLLIAIDLTKDFGPSSSGKTNIVASSQGFAKLGGAAPGISLNLTVAKKSA